MCIRDRIWGQEQNETLQLIKDKFFEPIRLRHPDFKKPFFLNCDASDISLGTTLYQEDEEGEHLVISFASRSLNQCEKNYNVTEKELLSVVFACGKFRTYILGYPVTVRTDHKSISFLRRCKLSHGRLTRWILALQAVSYTHLDVYKRQTVPIPIITPTTTTTIITVSYTHLDVYKRQPS